MMANAEVIELAAALLLDARQGLILVRKRGTSAFMQPGGKIARGERPVDALVREIEEELRLCLSPNDTVLLGVFTNVAANEPGRMIRAHLFHVMMYTQHGPITPYTEIEEVTVVGPRQTPPKNLAPLTRDQVLPLWYDMIGASLIANRSPFRKEGAQKL